MWVCKFKLLDLKGPFSHWLSRCWSLTIYLWFSKGVKRLKFHFKVDISNFSGKNNAHSEHPRYFSFMQSPKPILSDLYLRSCKFSSEKSLSELEDGAVATFAFYYSTSSIIRTSINRTSIIRTPKVFIKKLQIVVIVVIITNRFWNSQTTLALVMLLVFPFAKLFNLHSVWASCDCSGRW